MWTKPGCGVQPNQWHSGWRWSSATTAGAAHAHYLPFHCARRLLCSASVCDAPTPYSRAAAAMITLMPHRFARIRHRYASASRSGTTSIAQRSHKRAAAQQGRVPRQCRVSIESSSSLFNASRFSHCAPPLCPLTVGQNQLYRYHSAFVIRHGDSRGVHFSFLFKAGNDQKPHTDRTDIYRAIYLYSLHE